MAATPLWDNLVTNARRYPHKPALVFFGRVYSYGEVVQQAQALASQLWQLGVRKGDRVLIYMPMIAEAAFAMLGAAAMISAGVGRPGVASTRSNSSIMRRLKSFQSPFESAARSRPPPGTGATSSASSPGPSTTWQRR